MDRTTKGDQPEQPTGTVATAVAIVDEAISVAIANGPVATDYHGAWANLRALLAASMRDVPAPPPPPDVASEARRALERYAGAIQGLEPNLDSAIGVGVAAATAVVRLLSLGVVALAELTDELRVIAVNVQQANRTGWGQP